MKKLCSVISVSNFVMAIKELQVLQIDDREDVEIPQDIAVMAAEAETAIRQVWAAMDRADATQEIEAKEAEISEISTKMASKGQDELVTSDGPAMPPKIDETEELLKGKSGEAPNGGLR